MELKDVILSTLAEMEDTSPPQNIQKEQETVKQTTKINEVQSNILHKVENIQEGELVFLNSMRERLLVLFEGFQAPNNTNIEAKIDMTLNFLEYMLANIDSRVEELSKKNKH